MEGVKKTERVSQHYPFGLLTIVPCGRVLPDARTRTPVQRAQEGGDRRHAAIMVAERAPS